MPAVKSIEVHSAHASHTSIQWAVATVFSLRVEWVQPPVVWVHAVHGQLALATVGSVSGQWTVDRGRTTREHENYSSKDNESQLITKCSAALKLETVNGMRRNNLLFCYETNLIGLRNKNILCSAIFMP